MNDREKIKNVEKSKHKEFQSSGRWGRRELIRTRPANSWRNVLHSSPEVKNKNNTMVHISSFPGVPKKKIKSREWTSKISDEKTNFKASWKDMSSTKDQELDPHPIFQ